jgi:hypothetical protein
LAVREGNIARLEARELLRDHGGSLTPDQLLRALLLTTGDKRKADLERSPRTLEAMRRRQSG